MGHPPSSGSPSLSFTGEEGTADSITDEYDFLARKLHSAQGRWISPDPAGLDAVDPSNPQSWNRYAYVNNNPLASVDPLGLRVCQSDPCSLLYDGGGGYAPGEGNSNTWLPSDPWGTGGDSGSGISVNGSMNALCGADFNPCGAQWGSPLQALWQDALGLPTIPCQSQFGPWCDPGKLPNPWIMDAEPGQMSADRSGCVGQAAKAAVKDLIYFDLANKGADFVDRLFVGGQKDALGNPLYVPSDVGSFGGAGIAIDLAGKGADTLAESSGATQWIRSIVRSEGFKISARRVGNFARVGGKLLGALSVGYTAYTAWNAYSECTQ